MQNSRNKHLLNEAGLEFSDISSEVFREYIFPNNEKVHILSPLKLNVSKSGGHRILDNAGVSHYIPAGWIHLRWQARKGKPNFVR